MAFASAFSSFKFSATPVGTGGRGKETIGQAVGRFAEIEKASKLGRGGLPVLCRRVARDLEEPDVALPQQLTGEVPPVPIGSRPPAGLQAKPEQKRQMYALPVT